MLPVVEKLSLRSLAFLLLSVNIFERSSSAHEYLFTCTYYICLKNSWLLGVGHSAMQAISTI